MNRPLSEREDGSLPALHLDVDNDMLVAVAVAVIIAGPVVIMEVFHSAWVSLGDYMLRPFPSGSFKNPQTLSS